MLFTVHFVIGVLMSMLGSILTILILHWISTVALLDGKFSGEATIVIVRMAVFAMEVCIANQLRKHGWRGTFPGVVGGLLLTCLIPMALCAVFGSEMP